MAVWQGCRPGGKAAPNAAVALRPVAGKRRGVVFFGQRAAKAAASAGLPPRLTPVAGLCLPAPACDVTPFAARLIAVVVPDGPFFSDVARPPVA